MSIGLNEVFLTAECSQGLSRAEIADALAKALADSRARLRKVLLVVPDYTRYHSNAGLLANIVYHMLKDTCRVDLLEALGTHVAMTRAQCADMYGDIPLERFIAHDWRKDVVRVGEVPAEFVHNVSEGTVNTAIPVEINRLIVQGGYDLILSIGQVVPHEVVGMANHAKNLFVGAGGAGMINASHMLGAFYGMERVMGKDHSPVRKVFDYALAHFLAHLPIVFALTVTTAPGGAIRTHGLFIGAERSAFERAVALSQEKNLTFTAPLRKVVVYLDENEFQSTWLGNKAIYRTRMAIADGGELLVLAPGVERFGEDADIDALIRKYGYCGREKVIKLCAEREDLRGNLSAAAHLIHGSADGRFRVTYATEKLTRAEVEGVCFDWAPCKDAMLRYDPRKLKDGENTLADGEQIFYISNPALGLWADKSRF